MAQYMSHLLHHVIETVGRAAVGPRNLHGAAVIEHGDDRAATGGLPLIGGACSVACLLTTLAQGPQPLAFECVRREFHDHHVPLCFSLAPIRSNTHTISGARKTGVVRAVTLGLRPTIVCFQTFAVGYATRRAM